MKREISKDIRSRIRLSNCTGDCTINTKIKLTILKGEGRQNFYDGNLFLIH
jgi:hypothetical protein